MIRKGGLRGPEDEEKPAPNQAGEELPGRGLLCPASVKPQGRKSVVCLRNRKHSSARRDGVRGNGGPLLATVRGWDCNVTLWRC